MAQKRSLNVKQLVRKLARERIGPVPASKPIKPKVERKPKYKVKPDEQMEA